MKAFICLVLVLGICGCGRSTPTRFYLLESSLPPLQAENLPTKSLRVAQVETPSYLNRNNIVSRVQNETQLILAEFHLWAEPVSNGVRRVVEEVLTAPMLKNGVNVLPSGSEERGDYTLLIDVQRLDGNFNEKAVFEARWSLLDINEKPVSRGIFSDQEMVPGANYDILVGAESRLVRKFGDYLAARLPGLMQNQKRQEGEAR